LYSFFAYNLKKFLEFIKLVETLKTKGLKLLRNVKIHWISMLSPLKRLLAHYKSLVVKMHFDCEKNKSVYGNFELFCDLDVILGLPYVMPILEVVHYVIKYAQCWGVFIMDILDAINDTLPSPKLGPRWAFVSKTAELWGLEGTLLALNTKRGRGAC